MSDPDAATTAAAAETCEHVYVSEHKPGHRIYWLRHCMLCCKPEWEIVDEQIDAILAALARPVIVADVLAQVEAGVTAGAQEVIDQAKAEARAAERQRIAGGMVAAAIEMGYTEFGGFSLAWPHLKATYEDLIAELPVEDVTDLLDGDGDG